MNVTSYSAKGNVFVFIEATSTPEKSIPNDILGKLGPLKNFKSYEIEEDEKHPRIGMDVKKVYSEIKEKGYHIHKVVVEIRES